MLFNIQYAIPKDDKIAVSDWKEFATKIEAEDCKQAKKKFNQTHQHLGTWIVLDCWPI